MRDLFRDTVGLIPLCLMANRLGFLFCLCWALAPFPVVSLFFLWRNANLAGGFAGRLLVCVLVVVVFFLLWICHPYQGTTECLADFSIRFTCLYQVQDRALEQYRPH